MLDAKLEEIRRRLLDLTRNNRLLNHRTGGQRTLEIIDAGFEDLYRILADESRVMQFIAREEAPPEIRDALPAAEGAETLAPHQPHISPSLPLAPVLHEGPAGAGHHHDRNLQTVLSGEKLQTRLVHLAREATSAIQEVGCNILYCTFGMVHWSDAEQSSVTSRAPLVFVPVELKRKSVKTRYAVQMFDDDIIANPSLIELCQSQFRYELPAFDPENDDLAGYFAKVQEAIAQMNGWRFTPEIHLGLFSFAKLRMFRDLDPRNWPQSNRLTDHPLIQSLTGVETAIESNGQDIPDPATLDQILKPVECFQVVDADSSQQSAILAAKRGISMVIDGPPGTGKSQTITNIIAECLAAGKTVLFVSEKAAALEVVRRRLAQVGLEDFVLELHSRQASKKNVLEEINRVLERQSAPAKVSGQTAEELQRTRDALNDYRRELHEPLGALNISPFEAMSRAIKLAGEPEAQADIPDVAAWTSPQLAAALDQLRAIDRKLGRVGESVEHPWRGVRLTAAGIKQKQQIEVAREELIAAIGELLRAAPALSGLLGLAPPGQVNAAAEQIASASILLNTGMLPSSVARDERWNTISAELAQWLHQGNERAELKKAWQPPMRPEAELSDWQPVLDRRRRQGGSIWRFFVPSWYSDGKRLRALIDDGKLPKTDRQIQMLEALVKSAGLRNRIEQGVSIFSAQFSTAWTGIEGDWQATEKFAASAVALRREILAGRLNIDVAVSFIEARDPAPLAAAAGAAQKAQDQLNAAWGRWLAAIAGDEADWLGGDWKEAQLREVVQRLESLKDQFERLDDWIDYRNAIGECGNTPLAPYIQWAMSARGIVARGRLATVFSRHFHRLWLEQAFGQRASLRGFRGQDHDALITRFAELDRQWLRMTRDRLEAIFAQRRPDWTLAANRQSRLGLLQAEIRKKTRHISLRKLLSNAGEVVQSIKPCFMMSPLSVAQFLAPGGMDFDVAIFDEASQVEPADAYGAIARARQLILVGDERQLPPTSFFDRVDPEQPDESEEADVQPADLESILSLGIVRLRHRCGLRWHYRSRHSSLIEFSNEKFYDGQLRVFPSPHTDCSELGLAFRFVDNSVYLRGAGRYNPIEAQIVAAEVIRHAIETPELSLGVGTLNQPQQRAIEDEIERLRRASKDARVESFFARDITQEPFFVKNLENIQGDERDVILLSVGFGKDANGRLHLGFGALNTEGGWRRLNVLITRARRRCIVFSSIRHDDLDLGGISARGVIALKEYLYAAEHGGRVQETAVPGKDNDHDSDFEADVCAALRAAGWEVHAQVGSAGFAIDLAVVDPRSPGRYLLGIECDGATYHSSPTARDRDRLRQAVLEDLGWTIHRIWSTDWFQRPKAVLEILLKRLSDLKQQPVVKAVLKPVKPPEADPVIDPPEAAKPPEKPKSELPPGVVAYLHNRAEAPLGNVETLLGSTTPELARIVEKIVATEGPIHHDEAMRAFTERFDAKATARPREAFDRALAVAVVAGTVIKKEHFLWPGADHEIQIRYRADDCPVTDPEMIPPQEMEAAIKLVVRRQFGAKSDAVTESVARAFGFTRTGTKLKSVVEHALARLEQNREVLRDDDGFITLPR